MKVGMIDADLMYGYRNGAVRFGNTKATCYPNLVLMKLSAWHKSQGDDVVWYAGFEHYDRVYISKVFSTTPDIYEYIDADEIWIGGTGYQIQLVDGKEVYTQHPDMRACGFGNGIVGNAVVKWCDKLPSEVEHMKPDYTLYPEVEDTAYGFLTRGCPRGCGFCHVAAKEGRKSYKVADLSEWWSGEKNILLMDPNILGCKERVDLLTQLADSGARIDINQGLDARLLREDVMEPLRRIRMSRVHFAWDDYKQGKSVLKGLEIFKEATGNKYGHGHRQTCFVLTNFDTTLEQDLERIYTLRDMDFSPYVMIYDKAHADATHISMQRWVNMPPIFNRVRTFEEYNNKLAKE